jgi:hypothetical protein
MPPEFLSVSLRLSPSQAGVISEGLDFLASTWGLKQRGRNPGTTYPFLNKPLAPGKTAGTFSQSIMDRVVALRDRMKPKVGAGGRMQMGWLELRIATYACRVALDQARHPLSIHQTKVLRSRSGRPKSHPEVAALARKTRETIKCLERHQKKATRLYKTTVSDTDFSASIGEWKQHLRWMRMHLAFFREGEVLRAGPSLEKNYRKTARKILEITLEALDMEGYQLPPTKEVREAVRTYLRYCRRGRIAHLHFTPILRSGGTYNERVALGEYIATRLRLRRVRAATIPTGLPMKSATSIIGRISRINGEAQSGLTQPSSSLPALASDRANDDTKIASSQGSAAKSGTEASVASPVERLQPVGSPGPLATVRKRKRILSPASLERFKKSLQERRMRAEEARLEAQRLELENEFARMAPKIDDSPESDYQKFIRARTSDYFRKHPG